MLPNHVAVLKAKEGEFEALSKLDNRVADKVLPLFEIGRLTKDIRARKYIRESSTPTMTYLNRVVEGIGSAWLGRPAMIDCYQWLVDARAENGDHVVAYMVSRLRDAGLSIIPVIGYDRWDNADYQLALKSISPRDDGHYCLRLDRSAIEDSAEPDHFRVLYRIFSTSWT